MASGGADESGSGVVNGVGEKGRGAFILFEGVDRCGKTTQANLLVESLKERGHDVCFMRFPGIRRSVFISAPLVMMRNCGGGSCTVCTLSCAKALSGSFYSIVRKPHFEIRPATTVPRAKSRSIVFGRSRFVGVMWIAGIGVNTA